mgnify:CR=1 FL=1
MAEENPFLALVNTEKEKEENPFLALVNTEAPKEEEPEQGVIESIARGGGAGLVDIFKGISELGAAGLEYGDLIEEGNQQKVTQFFDQFKESAGLMPERTAGKITQTIVNYGAPGLGVFSWLSKARRAGQAVRRGEDFGGSRSLFGKSAEAFGRTKAGRLATGTRPALATSTALGTGVADILVSPSDMTTLADSWDAMPDFLRTEDEEGLVGKDLAATRLRNKLRLGVEGAGFVGAAEAVLPVVGATVRTTAQVPGVPTVARALSSGISYIGARLGDVPFIRNKLTPDGFTPPEIATAIRTAEGMTEGQEQAASKLVSKYDSAIKKAIRLQSLTGRGRSGLQRAHNDTMDFLTGELSEDAFRSSYGKAATEAATNMRNMIDEVSTEFESSVRAAPNLDDQQKADLLQQFSNGQGTYIRRLYELHLQPNKFLGTDIAALPQYAGAKQQVTDFLQRQNPQLPTGDAARQAEQAIDDIFDNALQLGDLTNEQQARQLAKTVGQGFKENQGRTSLFRLAEGMLKDRTQMLDEAPMLREMMGEVRNPREAFLRTIDNMATTRASQRLFDDITSTGVKSYDDALQGIRAGARPLVVDGTTVLTPRQERTLTGANYVKLGELDPEKAFGGTYGSLSGNYVPNEIYNSLTTPARTHSGAQDALAVALQLKGLSQVAKTVFSPIAQVRNFLSNTFIIGANGLWGRNTGIFESAEVLLANALDSPKQARLLKAMSDEGAIGQNIQLNELTRLLKESVEGGVSARLQKAGDAFRRSKAGAPVRFMEKAYQMGDDYWKVVGALGEKARYGAALRKAGLDIENLAPEVQTALRQAGIAQRTTSIAGTDFGDMLAIDLVKQTMPTYSMVPQAIKDLRRIPVVGNFMAFPAEIIRTSGNIVNRSLKEMGMNAQTLQRYGLDARTARVLARQIRGIGAQRLSGYVSMATVAPLAMRGAAHEILEITPEEEEVLEKSAPFWTLGNTLMYLTKPNKKGEAEYVDLSYMLPYEFMLTPARAALRTYANKGEVGAGEAEQILSASFEAFKKFAEPFASEGLAAERVIDVTTRKGKTQTGAEIYEEGELVGDKLKKSVNHVMGAFVPGIVDQFVTVKSGKFEPGRVTRAASDIPSREGDPYKIAEEAGTMMTGLRPLKLNIGRSLQYQGGEYSALRSSAVQIFTKVADDNDATEQDVLDAYVKANEAKRRHQAQLKSRIDAAMAAGMSKREVFKALENTGVSKKEINLILRDRYLPINLSRDLIREVNQEVNVKKENRILQRLPKAEINELKRSLRNTSITPKQENVVVDENNPFLKIVSPQVQPTITQIPVNPPQVQPTITQNNPQSMLPFLSGNPIDALKNLEILQRLRGTNPPPQ